MRTDPEQAIQSRSTLLVTGGAGFIGSFLCERLLAAGCNVLCVDNLFTGSKDNIEHLIGRPAFEFMRHDVTMPLYVEVDGIFNLACPASPVHYQLDPVQTTKTSVHGAINLLGLAKRLKAPILQASTSEVYGDPLVHPQTEDYAGNVNLLGPRARYDEGKRCAETLFFAYLRPPPTDDPRQRQPDIGEAERVLAWAPQVPLADGLRRTIDYFDDLLSGRLPPDVARLAPQRQRAAGFAEDEAPFRRGAAPGAPDPERDA